MFHALHIKSPVVWVKCKFTISAISAAQNAWQPSGWSDCSVMWSADVYIFYVPSVATDFKQNYSSNTAWLQHTHWCLGVLGLGWCHLMKRVALLISFLVGGRIGYELMGPGDHHVPYLRLFSLPWYCLWSSVNKLVYLLLVEWIATFFFFLIVCLCVCVSVCLCVHLCK